MKNEYFQSKLATKLGPMLAISDEETLYLLEFVERKGLERELEKFKKDTKAIIIPGRTKPLDLIEKELDAYFNGTLKEFKTPISLLGTPFQKCVWEELQRIPHSQTRSYGDMALSIGRPTAFRAVARANSTNKLAIVVPCHRVINSNGDLGGYAGGIVRKEWLITHEKQVNFGWEKDK